MTDNSSLKDSNCAGFYHWPPVWLGNDRDDIESANSIDPNKEVFSIVMKCAVEVRASLKGVFVFDFSNWPCGVVTSLGDWERPILARMRFMNLLLACFYSVVFQKKQQAMEKMFIDLGSYAFASELDLNPFHFGCDVRQAAVIQKNEEFHKSFPTLPHIISLDIVSEAISLTDVALANQSNDAATLGELLLHAFALHDSGRYQDSHISAWTIAERCMNQIWFSHLEDADRQHSNCTGDSEEMFINSKRREKLTGGDFTASIISEILSLRGLLPFEQYKLTCAVRKARNNWLHNLRPIESSDSLNAINLARFMLRYSHVLDVDIPFHPIGSIPIALVSH